MATGPTGAFKSGTKIYFKANAAGSFGVRRHRGRRRFRARLGDLPGAGDRGVDPRGGDGVDAGGWAVRVDHVHVGEWGDGAGDVHGDGGGRSGEHGDECGDVHGRFDRADRGRSPRRWRRRTCGAAVAVTSSSADARFGRRVGAVPDLDRGCRVVVEPGCRGHGDAVRDDVGHDDVHRRSLRPAGDHDRQRGEHVHVARPSPTCGSTTPRPPVRSPPPPRTHSCPGRALPSAPARRTPDPAWLRPSSRPRHAAPARGATSAPPTRRRPTA